MTTMPTTAPTDATATEQRPAGAPPENPDPGALAQLLLDGVKATLDTFTVHLGVRLGLYEALGDGCPATPGTVAERAGVHPRYAREWLEQQAALGVVVLAEDSDDPLLRTFTLPEAHRAVLLAEEHPCYLGSAPRITVGIAAALPELARCFRTGDGLGFAVYGGDFRQGLAGLNRPGFRSELAPVWLRALPEVHRRLAAGEPLDVLDLGCGTGWSSISFAEAHPAARVVGVDLDEASIREARGHAAERGVADRVSFLLGDAARPDLGAFDLACVFEALHDMADPVAVLTAVRRSLRPGGVLLVADEKVAERFSAPAPVMEQFTYAVSVLHCLPATRAEGAVEDAGAVLRPPTVREYARRAGFTSVEQLDIEHDMWNFYRFDT